MQPPRALHVPYGLGFPLGAPGDPELQTSILRAQLALCLGAETPVMQEFAP